MIRTCKSLASKEDGGTTLEFGMVVPLFVVMLVGVIEIGMLFFANTALEGGLREAARFAITGRVEGETSREEAIINIINRHGYGIVTVSTADISTEVYQDFADIDTHEPIVGDRGEIGTYEAGIDDGYTDINCNGAWDDDMGKNGVGGGNDVVIYVVDYQHELMTNFLAPMIGTDGKVPLTARVAVRNEPFGNSELCLDAQNT